MSYVIWLMMIFGCTTICILAAAVELVANWLQDLEDHFNIFEIDEFIRGS